MMDKQNATIINGFAEWKYESNVHIKIRDSEADVRESKKKKITKRLKEEKKRKQDKISRKNKNGKSKQAHTAMCARTRPYICSRQTHTHTQNIVAHHTKKERPQPIFSFCQKWEHIQRSSSLFIEFNFFIISFVRSLMCFVLFCVRVRVAFGLMLYIGF